MTDETSDRRQRLQENLARIVEDLRTHYQPEEIILFGSLASGHITPTSDLDLLIIKKTDKPFLQRLRDVVSLCNYDVGVDFLVYTPEEFSEESRTNQFVKNEILAKGKVIYRAAA